MVLKFENNCRGAGGGVDYCVMEIKGGKSSNSVVKGLVSLNGFNLEWLGQKSDYVKLRGGKNVGVVGVDFSINKFRNEGKVIVRWNGRPS